MTALNPSRRHLVRSLMSGSMLLPAIVQDLLSSSGDTVADRKSTRLNSSHRH